VDLIGTSGIGRVDGGFSRLIFGLLVILPIAVCIVIIAKLIEVLEKVAKLVGFESTIGAGLAIFLGFVLLLAFCYGVGTLVHTKIGAWSFEKFEKGLLQQIPGYSIIRNLINGFTSGQIETHKPAMIQLGPPGTAVIGFVMEENDNGLITVFVPNAPTIAMGGVHIVERKRVTLLEAGHLETITCISEWGIGSNKLIGRIEVGDHSSR
jgi:uncharacterized membrane protein